MVNKKKEKPYRVGELAKLANVLPSTVWHHIKRGNLKAFRWDDRAWYMIHKADAHAWLKERSERKAAGDNRYKITGVAID